MARHCCSACRFLGAWADRTRKLTRYPSPYANKGCEIQQRNIKISNELQSRRFWQLHKSMSVKDLGIELRTCNQGLLDRLCVTHLLDLLYVDLSARETRKSGYKW